ncbi:stage III sporulation protein AG [Clostridium sp. BJN0001]|uniref:stage III sporulation protein AG n=1 Tax=Clostridium sp. BJN0001 TaxID=2930219 RepID=UPI001FD25F26|nr:stage III sporulation protein AG [Clostridium sp. BJN0001]
MSDKNDNKFTPWASKIFGQKKIKNLLTICLILAFLVIAIDVLLPSGINIMNTSSNDFYEDDESIKSTEVEDYEQKQKEDLINILKKINGVGNVDVMISFENGEEKVPAYDKTKQNSTSVETDNGGGKRENSQNTDNDKIVMTSSNGTNEPFILETKKPKIIGVLIVSEGASDSKIKYQIEKAVSNLYNLSLDKVNVYSMKK